MEFKGNSELETVSGLLQDESPRCAVIVSAAFVDATLSRLLGDSVERSLNDRINDGRTWGLLTDNEHSDLHALRRLRNSFAHDMQMKDFNSTSSAEVASLKTWQVASDIRPFLREQFATAFERLLFVVGVIGFRLQRRVKSINSTGPLPEPPIDDFDAWPPVSSR